MIDTRLGPYVIQAELGSGGMGTVYRACTARDVGGIAAGTTVAIKIVHAHLMESEGFHERFRREAEIGKTVAHENVVRTLDFDSIECDGERRDFIVMEYVEGDTLRSLLEELERVPEDLCRHIGREIAKALDAIHGAGAIHRDLKPENILITDDHVVKVMDLGLARLENEAMRLSRSGGFVGSVLYAAPEQFRGRDADARVDYYALGLILYELATGRHPSRADDFARIIQRRLHETPRPAAELNPQLSPYFEEVLKGLLERDPDRRLDSLPEEESAWWRERARFIREQTRRPLRRIRVPRETALIGRDAEMRRLREAFERAGSGEGQVVLIEGEAGIGKTRLLDQFVSTLNEDVNVLFGSYPPGGAVTAAGAFSTAYREHFGDAGSAAYLPTTPLLVPAFDAVLRGEPPPLGEEPLTKDSLQTVFVTATKNLAAERPTIVLIDDLHFAPAEGRALFTAIAHAIPEDRVLLIGATRPGLPTDWRSSLDRLPHVSELSLPRLRPKDLGRLLTEAFQSERLAEEIGFKIVTKSDGNPFFVFEIIRGLREGKFITRRDDGEWVSTRVIRDIQIPSTVMELIQARIVGLDDDDKNLLDVASCCGFEFDPRLVADALGQEMLPAMQRLARLESKRRLVRSVGRRFVFDHHQVREALYEALPELLRESSHAALGDALEARLRLAATSGNGIDGALAVDLAEHFIKGASGRRALRYLDAALDHLDAGCMNDQAIALVNEILAAKGLLGRPRRLDLLLRNAERLDLLGRADDARAALVEALSIAEALADPRALTRARSSLGVHLKEVARYDEARGVLGRALESARTTGDRKIESRVTANLGFVLYCLGHNAEAHVRLERALELARSVGDRVGEAEAVSGLGILHYAEGRLELSREHHQRHLEIAQSIRDRRGEARATGNLGNVCWVQGRLDEAREHYERTLTIAREIGERSVESASTGNLGLLDVSAGLYEKARDHYERNLEIARETGRVRNEVLAMGYLGHLAYAQGQFDDARLRHERELEIAREIGYRAGEANALISLGNVEAALGGHEAGRRHLDEAIAICRASGLRRIEGFALHGLGDVHRQRGDLSTAERCYQETLTLCREIGARAGVAGSLVSLGSLLAAEGREDEGRRHLEQGRDLAHELGSSVPAILASTRLAMLSETDLASALESFASEEERLTHGARMEARFRLWRATRDPAHLFEAHRLLMFIRENTPEERRDSLMRHVPLHREIVEAWEANQPAEG